MLFNCKYFISCKFLWLLWKVVYKGELIRHTRTTTAVGQCSRFVIIFNAEMDQRPFRWWWGGESIVCPYKYTLSVCKTFDCGQCKYLCSMPHMCWSLLSWYKNCQHRTSLVRTVSTHYLTTLHPAFLAEAGKTWNKCLCSSFWKLRGGGSEGMRRDCTSWLWLFNPLF